MIGMSMAVRPPRQLSLLQQALSAIRRNNDTALYVPDDYGLVLGPELVTNGDFSVGTTGWSASGGATISASNGGVRVTSTGLSWPVAGRPFPTVIGKSYRLYGNLLSTSGATNTALTVSGKLDLTFQGATAKEVSGTFVATSTEHSVQCGLNGTTASGVWAEWDNISVREVISATTYIDSTGTQPVTAINDLVGLLTDRSYGAGNLGGELNTTGTAGWTGFSSTVVDGGASLSITNTTTLYGYAHKSFATVVGRTYRIKANATSTSGAGPGYIFAGTAAGTTTNGQLSFTSAGERQFVFVASATTTFISLYAFGSATGNSTTYQQISLVEVLGNHASQPTTASKPLVTRVPKRLGPNLVVNGTGDSATGWTGATGVWTGTVASVGGVLRTYAAGTTTGWGGAISTLTGLTVGRTYTLAGDFVAQAGWTTFSQTVIGVLDGGSAVVSLTPRATAGAFLPLTFVAPATTLTVRIRAEGTPNGAASTADFDNISVREVLEWTPALKFDGSNDLLTLSSGAILQQGSDHFVTAAFVLDAVGVAQVFYAASSTTNANPFVAQFGFDPLNSRLYVQWRDDAAAILSLRSADNSIQVGVPYVATVSKVGSSYKMFINGAEVVSGAVSLGATTLNTATIGALVRTTTTNYLNGKLIDIAIGQSTLTEADRRTIERNMAQRAGVAYAG